MVGIIVGSKGKEQFRRTLHKVKAFLNGKAIQKTQLPQSSDLRVIGAEIYTQARGYRDLNAGPGVGWLVQPSGCYFFFYLPIFGVKNGLETPQKPLY